ncbi:MAG TPA: DUF1679 domain-containing protein [Acidimicrobiales bacterium]|nr:DUF1679 domain-containing protein [Acidimicrobiales bacterium]
MTERLPVHTDEIDAEWLTDALRHGGWAPGRPELTVVELEIEPFGEGFAFLGSLARLRPTYEGPARGPESLILKLPTTSEGGRQVGKLLNTWWREAMFYAHLAEQLPPTVSVPHCVFNGVDIEQDRYALILADLAPAEPGDQVKGATLAEISAAVDALGSYHATWWGRPRPEKLSWVPTIAHRKGAANLQAAVEGSLDRFAARFGAGLPSASMDILNRFAPHLGEWLISMSRRPMTIGHADYRLENLLFHPGGGVTIIDWQTAMYTGGATDLAFLLGTSMDTELRREHEEHLLQRYLTALRVHDVPEDLLGHVVDDYCSSMLWWMGMLANNLSAIETPDARSVALFDAMLSRLHAAAIDLEAGRFIPS